MAEGPGGSKALQNEEEERRVAEKLLRQKVREEAQEMISLAYRATRDKHDYSDPRLMGTAGGTIRNFPESQSNLRIEMLSIFEEVLSEELEKRLGKKLPEEIITVVALILLNGAEHVHADSRPPF